VITVKKSVDMTWCCPAKCAGTVVVGIPRAGTACAFSPVPAAHRPAFGAGRCRQEVSLAQASFVKAAAARPAHLGLTQTVRRLDRDWLFHVMENYWRLVCWMAQYVYMESMLGEKPPNMASTRPPIKQVRVVVVGLAALKGSTLHSS
jgi:hypothetical protein